MFQLRTRHGKRFLKHLSLRERWELRGERRRLAIEHKKRLAEIKERSLGHRVTADRRYWVESNQGKYPVRSLAWAELRILARKPDRYKKLFEEERRLLNHQLYPGFFFDLKKKLEPFGLTPVEQPIAYTGFSGWIRHLETGTPIDEGAQHTLLRIKLSGKLTGRHSLKAWRDLLFFVLERREKIWDTAYLHRYYRRAFRSGYRNTLPPEQREALDRVREFSEQNDTSIPVAVEGVWQALTKLAPKRARAELQRFLVPHVV